MAEFEIPLLSESTHQAIESSFNRSDITELADGESIDDRSQKTAVFRCALIGVIVCSCMQIVREILKMVVRRPFLSSILYCTVSLGELL